MAGPITWRNVNAPNLSGASNMMGRAQESFNGAFDALRNTKDTYEEGVTDRNTQAFMDELSQYRNPEELAAAREAGTFQDLRSDLGANGLIDREKTGVNALDQRLATMQQQAVASQNHQDMQAKVDNRPLRSEILGLAASGEPDKLQQAQELFQANQGKFVDPSVLTGAIDKGFGQVRSQSNADRSYDLQERQFALSDEMQRARLALDQQKVGSARAKELEGRLEELQEEEQQNQVTQFLDEATGPAPDGTTKTQHKQKFLDTLYSDQFSFLSTKEKRTLTEDYEAISESRRSLESGDEEAMKASRQELGTQLQGNAFYAINNSTDTVQAITKPIIDQYTDENGNFLGIRDANTRQNVVQTVQNAVMGIDNEGAPLLESGQKIPPRYAMNAARSVINGWDGPLPHVTAVNKRITDRLQREINSAGFKHEYERYNTLQNELDQHDARYKAAAFNGGQQSTSGQSPLQNNQNQENVEQGSGLWNTLASTLSQLGGGSERNIQSANPHGPNYMAQPPGGLSDAERQEWQREQQMKGRSSEAQPQITLEGRPQGEVPNQLQANTPENKEGSGSYPSLDEIEMYSKEEGDKGYEVIGGRLSNIPRMLLGSFKESDWEASKESFDSLQALTQKPVTDANKKRAAELYHKHPGVIRYMTPQQQDKLKDLIGADKIARTLQRFE